MLGEVKNSYNIFVRISEGKRRRGRLRQRWENNNEPDEKTEYYDVNWFVW
jgi:hypothetical protein